MKNDTSAPGICSVAICDKPRSTNGLCVGHDARRRRGLDINTPLRYRSKKGTRRPCQVESCNQFAIARELCQGHFKQHQKGKPLAHLRKKRLAYTADDVCSVPGCAAPPRSWELCSRHYYRMQKYRFTTEEFVAFAQLACAICGAFSDEGMVTDHDHACCPGGADMSSTCGKCTRGPLCAPCNFMLGFAKDKVAVLESAITYLRDWQARSA